MARTDVRGYGLIETTMIRPLELSSNNSLLRVSYPVNTKSLVAGNPHNAA